MVQKTVIATPALSQTSKSKRLGYLVPASPPSALLSGKTLARPSVYVHSDQEVRLVLGSREGLAQPARLQEGKPMGG